MLGDPDFGCVYGRVGGGGRGAGGGGGPEQVEGLEAPPWRLLLPSTKVTTCCGMAIPSPTPAPDATP